MRGLILAAGRGSRCKELTEYGTKALIEFQGKRLLDWQIGAFAEVGINDLAVVTGYKADKVVGFEGTKFHNKIWYQSNMVRSLLTADRWLTDEPCVVSYSDIVYSGAVIKKLTEGSHPLAITYDTNWLDIWEKRFENPLEDAETFQVDESANLIEIGQRPENLGQVKGQFMGILKITPEAWVRVKSYLAHFNEDEINQIDTTKLLSGLLKNGFKIHCIPIVDRWYEIDSQEDIVAYDNIISEKGSLFNWR